MKRFFLSRKTVLSLITLLLGSVVLSYLVPQRMSASVTTLQKWHQGNPFLVKVVEIAGLDHVYTTPWFALLLGLFFLSLFLSTIQQFTLSSHKTFQSPQSPGGPWVSVSVTDAELKKVLKKKGYLTLATSNGLTRFVRHPWGYWGSFMLHVGFILVIASSLIILLTQKRGLMRLEEGEVIMPNIPWSAESHGLMADRLVLPTPVTLDKLEVSFWETDQIRQIRSTLAFVHPHEERVVISPGINEPVWYEGIKVYQAFEAGDNFYLEFVSQKGKRTEQALMFLLPARRDKASYNDFHLDWMPFTLRGKYYADAEMRSMTGTNPLLVLRLYSKTVLIGELPLKVGEVGVLGEYRVRLLKTGRWTGIIFVSITGMPGIFCGFFIIILGGGITYFTPPRVLFMRKEEAGVSLLWKAERFGGFYQEEFERIVAALEAKRL
jgi:hypothetical protein